MDEEEEEEKKKKKQKKKCEVFFGFNVPSTALGHLGTKEGWGWIIK